MISGIFAVSTARRAVVSVFLAVGMPAPNALISGIVAVSTVCREVAAVFRAVGMLAPNALISGIFSCCGTRVAVVFRVDTVAFVSFGTVS